MDAFKSISYTKRILDYAATKNKVIASNLANINNPNYKRKYMDDLNEKTLNFKELVSNELKLTNEKHISSSKSEELGFKIYKESSYGRNDKNNVNLDKELVDSTTNKYLYKTAVNIINSQFSVLESAITGQIK